MLYEVITPVPIGEGAAPPDVGVEDLADAEQQVVEEKHDGRRHQQIEQFRALTLQGGMHGLETRNNFV